MTRTATKQKASKQADTHRAEFQKMLEVMKEKTVGTLKENAVDVYEQAMIFISCAIMLMARPDWKGAPFRTQHLQSSSPPAAGPTKTTQVIYRPSADHP